MFVGNTFGPPLPLQTRTRHQERLGDRPAIEPRAYVAGYANDAVAGEDLLGITNEVEALSTLLASRALEPPLALGLFGDWGTGKTFFMRQMQTASTRSPKRSGAWDERRPGRRPHEISHSRSSSSTSTPGTTSSRTCGRAWRSAIFDGLDEAVETKDFPAEWRRTAARSGSGC